MNKSRWWWAVRSGKKKKKKKKEKEISRTRTCTRTFVINSFKDRSFDAYQRIEMGFKLGKYMSPIVISTTMSPSMSQNVFSYRVQPSLVRTLKICISRKSGPKILPGVLSREFLLLLCLFSFFLKKEEEKELFERISKRVRVRTNGALVRLKLIQRRVIIPEFLTFHDPLVQDPRNLLGNCVKFRAIYRRFGPRVSIFFFQGRGYHVLCSTPSFDDPSVIPATAPSDQSVIGDRR